MRKMRIYADAVGQVTGTEGNATLVVMYDDGLEIPELVMEVV